MTESLKLICKVKGKKKFHLNNMVLLISIASILLFFDFGHAVKKDHQALLQRPNSSPVFLTNFYGYVELIDILVIDISASESRKYMYKTVFARVLISLIWELKKTITATTTGTSVNKTFNEQNNGCVRAF